jgi:hypothetical protein
VWPRTARAWPAASSATSVGPAVAVTVGSMVSQTFELDGFYRGIAIVIGAVTVPLAIVLILIGDGGQVVLGVVFMVIGGGVLFQFGLWAPHRVTLDDSGVLLEAVARRVRIPWNELESVEPTPWDIRRQTLRWRRSRRRSITTLNAFPELHRMLVEIERRAPHAYVSS